MRLKSRSLVLRAGAPVAVATLLIGGVFGCDSTPPKENGTVKDDARGTASVKNMENFMKSDAAKKPAADTSKRPPVQTK